MANAPRFDVERVRLSQYRSIKSCDVQLADLTVLVGPNGAGKSNFVDSLRFVSQALAENLDNALRERGGVAEVRRRSNGHPTSFSVSLDFRSSEMTGRYEFRVSAAKGGDYRVVAEQCRVRDSRLLDDGDVFFAVRDGEVVSSLESLLPPTASDRLYLAQLANHGTFRRVLDGLSDINVYNLNPGEMRLPQRPDAGDLLRRDGGNIASVLEHLARTAPEVKHTIEEYLALVVPGTRAADRVSYGAYESIAFRQKVEGRDAPWVFPATSMSDGTLRALGILAALFAPGRTGFSPVGIEEPETALHPAAAGILLEALRAASRSRQVIATSHSPELLDTGDLGPANIVAVRARDGVTTIAPVDAVTAAMLDDRTYTAGELLRVDQLQPSAVEQPDLFS